MANLEDYLDWRNDVPFSMDPFNEVDNLLFSQLAYVAYDEIVPGPGIREKISIEEFTKRFFAMHSEEEILKRTNITRTAPLLLKKMVNTPRFGGTKLAGYINEVDKENKSQFSCISFYLPDNTIYVAFRGTDDSLIGWQEDFAMSFSTGTGGQIKAVKYLNDNFTRTMKRIRVGGHSKGGNFAVYASAFCRNSVKDNIDYIYSNDGPGFVDEIIKTQEYKSIVKRIKSFIPDQSIVGMLMNNTFHSKVITSNAKGINQHDAMTWQICKNHFVEAEQLNTSSIRIDETVKKWVQEFDYETRDLFLTILFEAFEEGGATKFSDITGAKLQSFAQVTKRINTLDKAQQSLFYDVLLKLAQSSGDTFKNSIIEKLSNVPKLTTSKKQKD